MATPRFTIIIPTLNEEKFLPNLLESIEGQTEKSFEVIVVDGASKDNTVKIARSFDKKIPISVIECDHARLPMQRNRGAAQARGAWLVFVDADSVLLPYCMSRLAVFIQTEKPRFVTSWGKPDSRVVQDSVSTLLYNMVLEGGLLFHKQFSPGPFTAIARSAFEAVGRYDESLEFAEDQNLSQRLADFGVPLAIIRETLFIWSMRRFRAQGMLKPMQAYLRASLLVFIAKRKVRTMPGYVMGGHLYDKKRAVKRSVLRSYEMKLKKLLGEMFK